MGATNLLNHQDKENSSSNMGDDEWKTLWEQRVSAISSFHRRLNRKHFFLLGVAIIFAATIFLANPIVESSSSYVKVISVPIPDPPKKEPEKPADAPAPVPAPDPPKDEADKPAEDAQGGKSAEMAFCTTWPVDSEGKYYPKSKPKTAQPALKLDSFAPKGGWKKPAGLKVVAMIFYGRRRNVDILDCYLRQNLAAYGGYLDEVQFMVHTQKKDDVDWLRDFVRQEPAYSFVELGSCQGDSYGCIWERAVEPDTLYMKIDDDIAYIHHDAIPQLIHTRLAQPHPYAISAQLVNSPVTALQQYHYGAIHAFLPDPNRAPSRPARETWRPSEAGPYHFAEAPPPLAYDPMAYVPPYQGHPWLLLQSLTDGNSSRVSSKSTMRSTAALAHTPMGAWYANPGPEKVAFGPGWKSWGAAAQQLYSLLYNLERNQMHLYHFGRPLDYNEEEEDDDEKQDVKAAAPAAAKKKNKYEGPGGENLFDMQYERYNLNFIAIWGRDVAAGLPLKDDELEITATIPLRLGRPFVIDTRSVVAHHAFYVQTKGIASTDLLDRWRAFANENVCAATNQKKPWDERCEGY
ncbi:hypothetical protein GGR54DRAFT_470636 [Hypoxylon sp. NC1633]|nr:hypothetical protein GGR54DRAFT_470636 [Hypoxylon sp. NC1633]